MKEKIISKIYEEHPELITGIGVREMIHLEHLLRTMSPKRKDFTIRLRLYENPMLRFESVVTETRTSYDLTLSVEENLNNKELCEFIHSLICE